MNDLVTPFLGVFLSEHLPGPPESWREDQLTEVSLVGERREGDGAHSSLQRQPAMS
jgi:hypothetical protein